jgi:hypothetical protein
MTEQKSKQLRTALFRNGFGFGIEITPHLPLWTWYEGEDPEVDDASIGVFDGFVIDLPFLKIFVGTLYY